MATSLKELRELTSNIEKKKKETEEKDKVETQRKKAQIKQETALRTGERIAQAEAAAKKAKITRQTMVLGAVGALLIAVVVSIRLMVVAWRGNAAENVSLATEGLRKIDSEDAAYAETAKFAENVMALFKKDPDGYSVPFYPPISDEWKAAFERKLSRAMSTHWKLSEISRDTVTDCLRAVFQSNGEKLVFDIAKLKNGELTIVKIH